MKIFYVLASLLIFASASFSQAQTLKGADSKPEDSTWSAMDAEKIKDLLRKTDIKKGLGTYEICAACHQPSGVGRSDGTFPQIAGQHASVLIKQMANIRAGLRDNPKMYPFVMTLTAPQELADVAAYISSLCIPPNHGKYEGPSVSRQLTLGKELYEKGCVACHGKSGEGDKEEFYPVIAGQHYMYLLRQMREIQAGRRHNVNQNMIKSTATFSDNNLQEISAYLASLEVLGAMCNPGLK